MAPLLFLIVAEGLGGLVKETRNLKLLSSILVSKDNLHVCLQQFVDDTLIFLELKIENVIIEKNILRWFEILAGFRVNFHKCSLGSIGVQDGFVISFARLLTCGCFRVPFVYLGVLVGVNAHREGIWNLVLVKL
uniref:Reverse transcriptase domain-containing protein n=1 Tax=Cajanus cajan TaxID=3821 RepID=A0A151SGT4_CAJCA|nr:hypothetical protein KK1_000206 [Cajanus cajan]